MKKITLLLLLLSSFAYCQVSTTAEEYNYLTKGYKIAMDSGLDLKNGYGFIGISTYDDPLYSFSFNQFIRTDKNEVCAIMVVADSKLWGNKYYYCIPLNNSDLYKSYVDSLRKWDKDILVAYSTALSSYLNLYNDYQNKKAINKPQ